MNTKALSLIIIFTALAAALNIYGPKIPFPLYPFLYFQLWEIPIVIAFLMVGPKSGIIVSVINTLILLIVFPGALPTGPFYNFVAVLAMFVGIYLPYWFAKRGCKNENFGSYLKKHLSLFQLCRQLDWAITLRVLLLTVINYFALHTTLPYWFFDASRGSVGIFAFRCNLQCHSGFVYHTYCNWYSSCSNVANKTTIKERLES